LQNVGFEYRQFFYFRLFSIFWKILSNPSQDVCRLLDVTTCGQVQQIPLADIQNFFLDTSKFIWEMVRGIDNEIIKIRYTTASIGSGRNFLGKERIVKQVQEKSKYFSFCSIFLTKPSWILARRTSEYRTKCFFACETFSKINKDFFGFLSLSRDR
jgi:hypothetical protein